MKKLGTFVYAMYTFTVLFTGKIEMVVGIIDCCTSVINAECRN